MALIQIVLPVGGSALLMAPTGFVRHHNALRFMVAVLRPPLAVPAHQVRVLPVQVPARVLQAVPVLLQVHQVEAIQVLTLLKKTLPGSVV